MNIHWGATQLMRGRAHGKLDGIASYSLELGLALQNMGHQLTPFVHGTSTAQLAEFAEPWHLPGYAVSLLRSCIPAAGLRASGRPDIVHSTDHLISRWRGTPHVATLMDAIPHSHPHYVDARLRRLKNAMWRKAAHWPQHILTLSDYSRQQIVQHFGLPEERISVVPLGVEERYFQPLSSEQRALTLSRHGLRPGYFLFIGTLQPRKNLERLIQAHTQLPRYIRQDHPLVIVGRHGWAMDKRLLNRLASRDDPALIWLQGIQDQDKRALLQEALALTFPSLLEGFGLPLLEAFASNLPVLASHSSAIPEVTANAAQLLDPLNVNAWSSAMKQIATDNPMQQELRDKGLHRARQFSWQACAQATTEVYRQTLQRYG